jgi:hypothetical protein
VERRFLADVEECAYDLQERPDAGCDHRDDSEKTPVKIARNAKTRRWKVLFAPTPQNESTTPQISLRPSRKKRWPSFLLLPFSFKLSLAPRRIDGLGNGA